MALSGSNAEVLQAGTTMFEASPEHTGGVGAGTDGTPAKVFRVHVPSGAAQDLEVRIAQLTGPGWARVRKGQIEYFRGRITKVEARGVGGDTTADWNIVERA